MQCLKNRHYDPSETNIIKSRFTDMWLEIEDIQLSEDLLGTGTFSRVVKAKYKNINCAAKIMDTDPMKFESRNKVTSDFIVNFILNEIDNHMKVVNTCVKIIGVTTLDDTHPKIILLLELATCTMHERLWYQLSVNKKRFSYAEIFKYSIQICKCIAQCHKLGIIHGDIKPTNLLYFRDTDEFKLADFSSSRSLDKDYSKANIYYTIPYTAPENFTVKGYGKSFNTKFDVFSFGVIMYQIFTLEYDLWNNEKIATNSVFESMVDIPTSYQIKKAGKSIPVPTVIEYSNRKPDTIVFMNIIRKCLSINPDNRYDNCADVLEQLLIACEKLAPLTAKTFTSCQ